MINKKNVRKRKSWNSRKPPVARGWGALGPVPINGIAASSFKGLHKGKLATTDFSKALETTIGWARKGILDENNFKHIGEPLGTHIQNLVDNIRNSGSNMRRRSEILDEFDVWLNGMRVFTIHKGRSPKWTCCRKIEKS